MIKWMTVLLLICLAGAAAAQEYTLTQREFLLGTPPAPDVSLYSEYLQTYWANYMGSEASAEPLETTTAADIWLASFPLSVESSSFGGGMPSLELLDTSRGAATFGIDKSWIYTSAIMPAAFDVLENATTMDPTSRNTIYLQQEVTRSFSGYPVTGSMTAGEAAQRNRIYLEQEIYSKFLEGGV